MANQTNTIFPPTGTNELPDASNSQCSCKLLQYLGKPLQSEGQHHKRISPKSKSHALPLSPLLKNNNIYSRKPPSGFYSNNFLVTSSVSNNIIQPAFRIGEKTDHYPGRFSFSHQRFFYTLPNPHSSSAGGGGLHADERLDTMSEHNRDLDHEMLDMDKNEDVFYIGRNSSAYETVQSSSVVQFTQPANSFTSSISRRRKLTQSLSGVSSPGPVRNKLSPVREYVPSTSSNADGSPTTPTNPMVCCKIALYVKWLSKGYINPGLIVRYL